MPQKTCPDLNPSLANQPTTNIDDGKLLDAIKRHVPDHGYVPMSG